MKQKNCLWKMAEVMVRSEGVAESVKIKEAGGRAGKRNGEVHSTNSSSNINLERVEAAQLGAKG